MIVFGRELWLKCILFVLCFHLIFTNLHIGILELFVIVASLGELVFDMCRFFKVSIIGRAPYRVILFVGIALDLKAGLGNHLTNIILLYYYDSFYITLLFIII
jgi:hypothetical protein